jgi:CubicO group peptidase (beta-lactamase class C family)
MTGASPVKAAGAGFDSGRLKQIPSRMKAFVEPGTVAGVLTLAVRHGEIASLEAAGYQDLETRQPMRADTIFQIASMTKPVTATAVMILTEEGRLALSDPVEKYLPEFRGMWVIGARDRSTRTLQRPSRPITI